LQADDTMTSTATKTTSTSTRTKQPHGNTTTGSAKSSRQKKDDQAIRLGAHVVRMQLLADQMKNTTSTSADPLANSSSRRSSKSTSTSSSERSSSGNYQDRLHITPQQTLVKLKALDDLHEFEMQRDLMQLRKLQSLEGRIGSNLSGSTTSSGKSSSRRSDSRSRQRRSSACSAGKSASHVRDRDVVKIDLQPTSSSADHSNAPHATIPTNEQQQQLNRKQQKQKQKQQRRPSQSAHSSSSDGTRSYTVSFGETQEVDQQQHNTHPKQAASSSPTITALPSSCNSSPLRGGGRGGESKSNKNKNEMQQHHHHHQQARSPPDSPAREDVTSHRNAVSTAHTTPPDSPDYQAIHELRRTRLAVNKAVEIVNREEDMWRSQHIEVQLQAHAKMTARGEEKAGEAWKQSEAYLHAKHAGMLWQTMVGEHVRFPKEWFGGARVPRMAGEDVEFSKWKYISRSRVRNSSLNSLVRRQSGGRILLHIVVRDLVTMREKEDIALGCFHPHAKGIVSKEEYKRHSSEDYDTDVREVWMAVRKRSIRNTNRKKATSRFEPSLVDPLLTNDEPVDKIAKRSPLNDERLSNENIKAIFGAEPPLETVFVLENELTKVIHPSTASYLAQRPPTVMLLQKYLFK